tara:strand:- start:3555 stop:4835 length:1281 start_codon:yes stop_codon:yes gene_type:complete
VSLQKTREYVIEFIVQAIGMPNDLKYIYDDIPEDIINQISISLTGRDIDAETFDPDIAPDVDGFIQWAQEIYEELCKENNIPAIWKSRWPNGKTFAVALTHDSDSIDVTEEHLQEVKDRFNESDLKEALEGKKNLYWNVERIKEIESKFDFHSSFYFLTSEYNLEQYKDVLDELSKDGWEIGLHAGFGTHENEGKMNEDINEFKRQLKQQPIGVREHYLQFDYHNTLNFLEKNQFVYDSSLGFREHPGFLLGTSLPFNPPRENWEKRKILELPLIIMDTSLWGYMNLNEDDGMKLIEDYIANIKKFNGLLTILWHQEAFLMKKGNIYPKILEKLAKEECFVSSGIKIAEWWNSRNDVELSVVEDSEKGWKCNIKNVEKGLCLEMKNFDISKEVAINGQGRITHKSEVDGEIYYKIELEGDCELFYV